jgi:signal transduction histidine kinase
VARRSGSLRLRITFVTTLVVAVVLGSGSFLLVHWLKSSQIDDADATLSGQVDVVAGYVNNGVIPQIITPRGLEPAQLQIVAPDTRVVALTPGLAESVRLDVFLPPVVGHQEANTTTAAELGAEGTDRYRVLSRTVPYGQDWVSIYAASSLQAADQVVRTLVLGLWLVVPVLVALAALATWFLTGRALRPVDDIRREVNEIQGAGTDQRLATNRKATELDRLAETLNGMLDRMSASEAIRRQFLADASHELRSPLASARTMLEVGLSYPDRTDWPGTASEVMVEVDRLEGLAAELLALARAEGGERALSMEPIDLGALVRAEVQRSGDARVGVHVATEAWVNADRQLMVRIVRNLLDNARRHAHTKVTVNVSSGEMVSVQVHNDGDEIPADERELIFEPFTRLDNARNRDEGGAGLGLSLARRIAEVHGGTLTVVDVTHGAAFLLSLPAAESSPIEISATAG